MSQSDIAGEATKETADSATINNRPLADIRYRMMTRSGGGLADEIGYDPRAETFHAQHDWKEDQSLSTTIIEAVGEATASDPVEMEPLYRSLDPDALNSLFRPRSNDGHQCDGQLIFSFAGHDVAVHSHGHIIVDVSG